MSSGVLFDAPGPKARRRHAVLTVLGAKGIRNPVLSFEEVGTQVKPAVLGLA